MEGEGMMKKTKILIGLLTLSVILTGCNSKTEKNNGNETNTETSVINKKDYTNPLICKKVNTNDYNTFTEYLVYDYDKEGKNVISYTEVNTYVYKEAQTTENKERYEKWYNCANFKNVERIQKCDSSWTNDKEYKVVKSFTEKVVSNLAGIPLDEMKSDPRKGYECE